MSWWDTLYQHIVSGLVQGSVYVLIAVGFTLCLGVLKLINITHGHFVMLGAFLTYQFYGDGIIDSGWFGNTAILSNYFICILFAAVCVSLAGAFVYYTGIRTVHGKGQIAPILTTIALALFIENLARVYWPGTGKTISTSLSDNVRNPIGQILITDQKIITFVSALLLVVVLYLLLNHTRLGKALRATTQDESAASLTGINPQVMFLVAMMLAAAFAGIAGALLVPLDIVEPNKGIYWLFKAFIVVLIGGMGNIYGAIVGGLLLGLLESLIVGLWDPTWVNVFVFGIIILILTLRPTGLLRGRGK
jgi:branched-chain amino acid transport system permease protein